MNLFKKIDGIIWSDRWNSKVWLIRKFFYLLRVFYLSIKGLKEDKIKFYSAALTYYSLLSIVPILALIFAVAKGFNLEKLLEKFLLSQLQGQEVIVKRLLELARSLLEKTKSSVIAGVGVLFLIWAVIRVFSEIDDAINDIWKSSKRRSLGRKFTDYFSLIIVAPIFYIISNSISLFLSHKFMYLAGFVNLPYEIVSLILLGFKTVPVLLLFILFSFMYAYIPTTSVNLKCAFVAGFIIAIFYVLFQRIAINLFLNINRYSAIYGSLSVLPILIIWIYISWILILFGAKISYTLQNFDKVIYDFKNSFINIKSKKHTSMFVWGIIANHYVTRNQGLPFDELLGRCGISATVVQMCVELLLKSGLIAKVDSSSKKEEVFVPLYDPHTLTVGDFIKILEEEGSDEVIESPVVKELVLLEEAKLKELDMLVIDRIRAT